MSTLKINKKIDTTQAQSGGISHPDSLVSSQHLVMFESLTFQKSIWDIPKTGQSRNKNNATDRKSVVSHLVSHVQNLIKFMS